jgi:hypothetical protein
MKKCSAKVSILSYKGNVNQNYTEVPPHSSQVSHYEENLQQQMLARMWGKRTLIHCWWECKLLQPYGKQYGGSSKN